jgi:streptogramin lyase
MAGYRDFVLPTNPPSPYSAYLCSLATPRHGETTVWYTKYAIGVIGCLDTASAAQNVTEWTYPAPLLTSTMLGAANLRRIDRDETSFWCVAADAHGAIVRFEPKSGTFTR